MKKSFPIAIATICTLLLILSSAFITETKGTLSIVISNIKEKGNVKVGLYRADDDFPDSKALVSVESGTIINGVCKIEIPEIAFGKYAIALFQDVNGNGKLDTKTFGIPAEPFAFSNNIRPKFGSPSFEKCEFNFTQNEKSVSIRIINSLFGND